MRFIKAHIKYFAVLVLFLLFLLAALAAYFYWGNPVLNELNKAIEMNGSHTSFCLNEKFDILPSEDDLTDYSRTRRYAFLKDEKTGKFSYAQRIPTEKDNKYVTISNITGLAGVHTDGEIETVSAENPPAFDLFTEKLSPLVGFRLTQAVEGDGEIYTWSHKANVQQRETENTYNYYVSPEGYLEKIILTQIATDTVVRENGKAVSSITTYEMTNLNDAEMEFFE